MLHRDEGCLGNGWERDNMSRKNHKLVDGRLLQTDKKFSALKERQREKISGWLLEEYKLEVKKHGVPLGKKQKEQILDAVYDKIQEHEIWIPYYEVKQYFSSRLAKWNRKYAKLNEGEEHEDE